MFENPFNGKKKQLPKVDDDSTKTIKHWKIVKGMAQFDWNVNIENRDEIENSLEIFNEMVGKMSEQLEKYDNEHK